MADWPRQLCFPGQMLTRTLEISKIPSWHQKLQAFLTILDYQNLVRQQQTNLLQNGNGPNFWSREGIFKKSSPVFLIWPREDNLLSNIHNHAICKSQHNQTCKIWFQSTKYYSQLCYANLLVTTKPSYRVKSNMHITYHSFVLQFISHNKHISHYHLRLDWKWA